MGAMMSTIFEHIFQALGRHAHDNGHMTSQK